MKALKILLADDDLVLCENIVEYFRLMNYKFDVVCVNDGIMAIESFKSLVLLDFLCRERMDMRC